MKLIKSFKLALNMVLHSKLRSWLTIIGIVIGIASVISIVGIGEGMTNQIESNLNFLNADIITITPGFNRAIQGGFNRRTELDINTLSEVELNNKDVFALKTIPNIDVINTKVTGNSKVTYLDKSATMQINGVDINAHNKISTNDIYQGRELNPSDSNVVLIGKNLALKYFEKEIKINQAINIDGRSFRIIGIIDDNSNSIFMSINDAYQLLTDKKKFTYDSIELKIKDLNLLNETENEIITKLYRSRNVNEKTQDFTVRTNTQANNTRTEMISTITLFLTAIASISLLVGAVGIANTMFTAVLEKTKQIGIMKAIGAKNKDIMIIFLLNSAIIGLIGGILGIGLGFIIAKLLENIGMQVIIQLNTVLIVIFISILTGVISGIIPAYNASKLDPVEALRRE